MTNTNEYDNLPAVRAAGNGNAIELRNVGAETQLAIHGSGRDYLVSAKDILEWVAPQAPLQEAKKFLVICQTTGLNPLLGEIDLLPFSGKYQAVVRKNGYLKCARRDPDYDGHESGISVQAYSVTPKNQKVKTGPIIDVQGTCVPDGHLLVGGWCKMYRRGISRPTYKRVSFSEYGKNVPGPWQAIPCTMIEKVAIAHACRESFDLLAGTYDDSEMDRAPVQAHYPAPPVSTKVVGVVDGKLVPYPTTAPQALHGPAPVPTAEVIPPTTPDEPEVRPFQSHHDRILELVEKVKMTGPQFAKMLRTRDVDSVDELDADQAQEIIRKLEDILDVQEWNPLGSTSATSEEIPVITNSTDSPESVEQTS